MVRDGVRVGLPTQLTDGVFLWSSYRQLSHLPIIIDPSHATGKAALVPPMAIAAVAAGADGLLIEVHNDPQHALCDGSQSLRPEVFHVLPKKLRAVHSTMRDLENLGRVS